MLANVSAHAASPSGTAPVIPVLPLEHVRAALASDEEVAKAYGGPADPALLADDADATVADDEAALDDEDPDGMLADESAAPSLPPSRRATGSNNKRRSEKERTLAELQLQRELVDSRMEMMEAAAEAAGNAAATSGSAAAAAAAQAEAAAAFELVTAEMQPHRN